MNYKIKAFNLWMVFFEKAFMPNLGRLNELELMSPHKNSKLVYLTIKSIGEYGLQDPLTFSGPYYVIWCITSECNFRCIHCSQDSGVNKKNELTLKEKFDVVDQLVDAGCVDLSFSGGEPLFSKDFFKVAEYAHKKGLVTKVLTNGSLITKDVAKKLKDVGLHCVMISLDGAKKETHEKIRTQPRSFERTVGGIMNCIDEKIPVYLATTLTKINYKEIEEIIDHFKGFDVGFNIIDFHESGRGIKNFDSLQVSPKIRNEVFTNLAKKSLEDREIKIVVNSPMFLPLMRKTQMNSGTQPMACLPGIGVISDIKSQSPYFSGCPACRISLVIDSNGDIKPCMYIDLVVGNTKKEKVSDVWKNSEVFKAFRCREDLKGNCGKCEDKYICGGCRTRAWYYYKDLKAPDPGCIKNIEEWNKIEKGSV
jgi:radical SAM protein with 4Fe4S-binding SPASM domain